MPKFHIHIKDGHRLWGDDGQAVDAGDLAMLVPHIQNTVREIIDGEGGPKIDEERTVEVLDATGAVVLTLPFVVAYGTH